MHGADAHGGGHGDPQGHGGGHGPADPHGHGDAADAHAGGAAELPPVPAERSITPAAADYALPHPAGGLLWPILWLAVAALLFAAAGRWAHPIQAEHGEPGGGAPAAH
jgi:hypothetical protein